MCVVDPGNQQRGESEDFDGESEHSRQGEEWLHSVVHQQQVRNAITHTIFGNKGFTVNWCQNPDHDNTFQPDKYESSSLLYKPCQWLFF